MTGGKNNTEIPSETAVADLDVAAERLGSRKLLKKVAILFRENAEMHLEGIRQAIQSSDTRLLEMSAHTFVSSMAYLSANAATKFALTLEQMGRTGSLQGSQQTYESLLVEIGRLDEVLDGLAAEEY